jgi:hypothetical protein
MNDSARCVFVYFRLPAPHEAAVAAAWRDRSVRWLASIPGLHCELMRRADRAGDEVTLMEVYRGLGSEAQARVLAEAAQALAAWPLGERHVEVFEPCA